MCQKFHKKYQVYFGIAKLVVSVKILLGSKIGDFVIFFSEMSGNSDTVMHTLF